MSREQVAIGSDIWSDWILHRRHADDPAYDRLVQTTVTGFADRVLDGARLEPGMTLVDIGSGDGLIPFRAIDRVGPSLRVILVDISAPLLHHAERLAMERGVREQCTFLKLSAEKLSEIADGSVDVVTTRAVLAYVEDKSAAMREFQRILKPGARISSAEPIFRDDALKAIALRKAIESPGPHSPGPQSQDRLIRLLHRWKAAQFPDTEEQMVASPITNYSERDLVQMAVSLGFTEVQLSLQIDVLPASVTTWDTFIGFSPHPLAPSLGTILTEQFSADEREFFEQSIRPAVEARQFTTTDRVAYLTARKPLG